MIHILNGLAGRAFNHVIYHADNREIVGDGIIGKTNIGEIRTNDLFDVREGVQWHQADERLVRVGLVIKGVNSFGCEPLYYKKITVSSIFALHRDFILTFVIPSEPNPTGLKRIMRD